MVVVDVEWVECDMKNIIGTLMWKCNLYVNQVKRGGATAFITFKMGPLENSPNFVY